MRFLLWLCLVIVTCGLNASHAQGLGQTEFDARLLSAPEKRIVQAALAFSGDYNGLLDGAWGNGSQRALERYTLRHMNTLKPVFADLQDLLTVFEAERQISGWRITYTDASGMSFAFPDGFLTHMPMEGTSTTDVWSSADERFRLILAYGGMDSALSFHNYAYQHASPGSTPYQSLKPGRLVTSTAMPAGIFAYVRSDKIGSIFMTVSILSGAEHAGRVALLSGSIQRGRGSDLSLPAGGVLAALLRPAPAPAPPAVATAPAQPFGARASNPGRTEAEPDEPNDDSAAPGTLMGSGTGFYINNTDLVTAAHVVAGCGALRLADGSALQVLAEDDALDLAALTGSRRSAVWLGIGDSVQPKLGETVMALGFPYLGNLSQGLTATNGNISALQGIDGGKNRIMISAPVQPGNSGGPLINVAGGVVGVVVSRVNDLEVLKSTGTLPQNMNFAVPVQPLNGFLAGAGVMFPRSSTEPIELGGGIPDQITAAVVPIYCYQ